MWVLSWKKYASSKFATFVSVLGALVRYAGVLCLFSSLIPAALICIAIGIALHFVAEAIAKSKATKANGKTNTTKTAKAVTNAQKTTAAQPMPNPVQRSSTPSVSVQPTTAFDGKIKCNKCGAINSTTNKFCNKCGEKIFKEKKCLRCGNTLSENDKFCGQCGYQSK